MQYKSIVISGQIASGTSTTARALSAKLNLPYHSAGEFFRKYLQGRGIPLYDKSQIPDDLDRKIDQDLSNLAQNSRVVVDGHYMGYLTHKMPQILRICLTCNDQTRFARAKSRDGETEDEIGKRQDGLDKKFRKLYANEDFLNPKFFNLVIDTSNNPLPKVIEAIISEFEK